MRNKTHGQKDDEEVDPDGKVGQPSKFLQRANLADEKAPNCPDKAADGVTQLEFGGLRECFTIGDCDDRDIAEELDRLEDVQAVSTDMAVEAESDIAIRLAGEFVRVDA